MVMTIIVTGKIFIVTHILNIVIQYIFDYHSDSI